MKDVAIVVLAGILGFLMYNSRVTGTYTASASGIPEDSSAIVSPDIVGAIAEQFHNENKELYPIETLFVNPRGDNVFDSRFMFFHTSKFYGAQYDIQARINSDGSVTIMKKTESAVPVSGGGFVPDKYRPWSSIQGALDDQLKKELSRPLPVLNMDNIGKRE